MNDTIVVFGGSFNPPTCAHLSLAEQLVDLYQLHKILFLPVGDLYQKKGLIHSTHRVNMLKKVFEHNEKFEISMVDVESDVSLYTVDALRIIQKQYPNKKIAFIMGTDNLRDLVTWAKNEELMSEFYLYVLQREGERNEDIIDKNPVLKKYKERFTTVTETIQHGGSSTSIRDLIQKGISIRYLVPDEVYDYIKKHKLYQKEG